MAYAIVGASTRRRHYFGIVKFFEMRYLGCWMAYDLPLNVFYSTGNQRCKGIVKFRLKTAESFT